MCVMCGFDCGYNGHDCTDEEFDYLLPEEVDDIETQPVFESEKSMKSKVEVVVEETAVAKEIIKKQSEVWVYDDEVYATYEKAIAAKIKDKISDPLIIAYYKRGGSSESQIKAYKYVDNAKSNRNFMVYLDDVVKLLPELIAELSKETA